MRKHLAQIPDEVRAPFEQNQDFYKFIASRILQKPVSEITREERQRTKDNLWLFFTMRGPTILTNLIQGDEEE